MLQKEWLYLLEGRIVNGKEAPPIVKKHTNALPTSKKCVYYTKDIFLGHVAVQLEIQWIWNNTLFFLTVKIKNHKLDLTSNRNFLQIRLLFLRVITTLHKRKKHT